MLNAQYIDELVKKAAEFGGGKIHIIVNNAGFTWDGVIRTYFSEVNLFFLIINLCCKTCLGSKSNFLFPKSCLADHPIPQGSRTNSEIFVDKVRTILRKPISTS